MTGRHRMTDLLGMRVRFADGGDGGGGGVVDVRLAPSTRVPGPLAELVVDGLVVGRRRPGTLFGYDRHPDQGPWAIRTGYLAWEDVERVDWDTRTVHVRTTGLRELTPAR
jgi:hypothetical protein